MESNQRSEAERLASRRYTIESQPSETTQGDPSWVAFVMELDGCIGQGSTIEEAIADVKSAMIDYIETMLEFGLPIPEPQRPRTATAGAKTKVLVKQIAPSEDQAANRLVEQFAFST